MDIQSLSVGTFSANCYLCWSPPGTEGLIIDPGAEAERILAEISQRQLQIRMIVLTHFHFDHVSAADTLRQATGAPVAIHKNDAEYLAKPPELFRMLAGSRFTGLTADKLLEDGEIIAFGDQSFNVMLTPGHSPGGICLYSRDTAELFSGDTLFRHGVGRTDFPGGDEQTLLQSIRTRLYTLPETTIVYPGHGPSTSIGEEKQHNPFVA